MNDAQTRHPEHQDGSASRWGSTRAAALPLTALLVFLTVGYFQNSRPGWNVNTQYALTVAIVERGTLRIDAYHEHPAFETGDKAHYDGHFYSDKSPVNSFLGAPVFWAYSLVAPNPGSMAYYVRGRFWTTWIVQGVCAAALTLLLARLLIARGVERGAAGMTAALFFVATPLLGYSIVFFNYTPAVAFAMGGWCLLDPLWRGGGHSNAAGAAFAGRRALIAGILLGLATWTLNTLGLLALCMTVGLAFAGGANVRLGDRARRLALWAVGGFIGAAGNFVYNHTIFDTIASPYRYEYSEFFREQMARGLMGAGWPRLETIALLTLHPFQGVFRWWPITLLGLVGLLASFIKMWRGRNAKWEADGRDRGIVPAAVAMAFFVGLLLYNSGYFMWWGGWAYAPRHMIPALPPLALGLAVFVSRRWPRRIVWAIAAITAVFNVAAVALDPQPSPDVPIEALMETRQTELWPSPYLKLQEYFWRHDQVDRNVGTLLGLTGAWSLAPLGALWLILGGIVVWSDRSSLPAPSGSRNDGPDTDISDESPQ